MSKLQLANLLGLDMPTEDEEEAARKKKEEADKKKSNEPGKIISFSNVVFQF